MRRAGDPTLRPLVVIGAARSGTRVLRDALAEATGAGVVPYDVGYVWRHGNQAAPDDCLPPEAATPAIVGFVRSFLGRYAGPDGRLVEKTVGNTLRVPFVARVLPEAAFVHVIRDGVEVTLSARRAWREGPDIGYLAAKARHVPLRVLPGHGRSYLTDLVRGRRHPGRQLPSWGPRYPGIDGDVATGDLVTVCARQWRTCVAAAERDLSLLSAPVCRVRHEDLRADPAGTLRRVAQETGFPVGPALAGAAALVRPRQDRGRHEVDPAERRTLASELGPLLEELGYDPP